METRFRLPGRGPLVIGGLLVVLVLLAILSQSREPSRVDGPTLSTHVTVEDGGRALYLWLAELGYDTQPLEYRAFELTDDIDAFFMLAPTVDPSETEAQRVLDWVERGGMLLIATEEPNRLLDDLNVELRFRGEEVDSAVPLQPVFLDPPLQTMKAGGSVGLLLPGPEWVPLLGAGAGDERPIAATARLGAGRVHILASEYPLTNEGIAEADNHAYVLHVLAGVERGGLVVFDEYHHGLTEHGTLNQRLVREPWGWAILWALVFVFAWLAFSGKRFGKAQATPPSWARRSSAEYVSTLGAMLRRGKHDAWLRKHYVSQVKRELASRYRIRADQPTREFVAALAERRADAGELAGPLERLESDGTLDEATTLRLMRDITAIRQRLGG